jgi:hypothetical protein
MVLFIPLPIFCSDATVDAKEACPKRIVNKKIPIRTDRDFAFNPGSDLLSHPVTQAVPSTRGGLTSVFGMGTGVSLSLWPPENSLGREFWWMVRGSWFVVPAARPPHSAKIVRQPHRETEKASSLVFRIDRE